MIPAIPTCIYGNLRHHIIFISFWRIGPALVKTRSRRVLFSKSSTLKSAPKQPEHPCASEYAYFYLLLLNQQKMFQNIHVIILLLYPLCTSETICYSKKWFQRFLRVISYAGLKLNVCQQFCFKTNKLQEKFMITWGSTCSLFQDEQVAPFTTCSVSN